jgi:glucose/arabinose dehydrogenase
MIRWLLALICVPFATAGAQPVLTGADAYGDWHGDAPGVWRHITPDALPPPFATGSASRSPDLVAQPRGVQPRVPAGFEVSLFASGLDIPRTLRTAPNGDVFLAESGAGVIRVFTGQQSRVFAANLTLPFGIGFWPPGPSPKFVYVAETNRVVRFPYPNGGPPEVIVPSLPEGGHWTRDLVFSPEGARMFVSVGSATNVMTGVGPEAERDCAAVLSFTPKGEDRRVHASGLRNCSAEAIQPRTGTLWCAVNERDGLGDDLPPDFATSVRDGGFYGWPWFYIGANPEPRHPGAAPRPVIVPDVLIQPHSAPLGITFYDQTAFPADYRGDAFVALHGSWNRSKRTGYKVIRLRFDNGRPTGEYEDFLTGFVRSDRSVWGRPVGVTVTVTADGALLVSEDGNGTIWRIAYKGDRPKGDRP